MNILFVYSLFGLRRQARPIAHYGDIQPGISSISACLKQQGHATDLVVLNSRWPGESRATLIDALRSFKPGVVAFTAVYSEYAFLAGCAALLKREFPGVFLLIGGPHVSLNPEGVLGPFDALCIGEGEDATVELVRQLEAGRPPAGIANLWIRRGGEIEQNPVAPFRRNLDELPLPDRALWQRWVRQTPVTRQTVLLGRGCPFECTYCCNHALRRLAPGKYVRLRGVPGVIDEIRHLARQFPQLREIYFEIETITVAPAWVDELCRALEALAGTEAAALTYGVNFRITPRNNAAALFRRLRGARFSFVNIGIESGSARVRREILNRRYDNEDIGTTVRAARDNGLRVNFYNLIGVPGETVADHLETVAVNRRCQPDSMWVSIFYPYPGTRLHAVCVARGLLPEGGPGAMERRAAVLDLPEFPKALIERAYVWFEFRVYRGRRPLLPLLAGVLRKRLRLVWFALAANRRPGAPAAPLAADRKIPPP